MIKIIKTTKNSFYSVCSLLSGIYKIIKPIGDKQYIALLCDDAATMVDNIALNAVSRPVDPIYNIVISELDKKINLAAAAGLPNRYNLGLSANIVSKTNATYIILSALNEFWEDCIPEIKAINGVSILKDKEADAMLDSQVTVEFTKQLYPKGDIDIRDEYLKFDSIQARALKQARYRIQNELLRGLSAGKEIQNYQINSFYDEVYELLDRSDIKQNIQNICNQLMMILPEITPEMIKNTP